MTLAKHCVDCEHFKDAQLLPYCPLRALITDTDGRVEAQDEACKDYVDKQETMRREFRCSGC